MAESGASSPELQETNQVDIDELLDQDEQDLRNSSMRGHLVDSSDDQPDHVGEEELEDNTDDEDDSEEAAAEEEAKNFYHAINEDDSSDEVHPPSPAPSPNPYAHPQIMDDELDFD